MMIRLFIFLLLITFSSHSFSQNISLIKQGAELKELRNDFKFTEGPARNKEGDVYFTDQPNNKIWKWNAKTNEISLFLENAGRSNGLFFDSKNNLYACADEKTELWKIDKNKKVEVLLSSFENKSFNGPNDLWIAQSGVIYFTDPFYARPWWNYKEMPQKVKNVYKYDPTTKNISVVANDFVQPNGIVGDGKVLYVADIGGKKTHRYDILSDGNLSERTLFCNMGSDGMTLDEEGNLYLTGNGVTVFNKAGEEIHHIDVPQGWTANITFGAKNRKTLFITASTAVYTLEMNVKGSK